MKVLYLMMGSLVATAHGFLTPSSPSAVTPLRMGIFDTIMKAFGNEEFAANMNKKASARHILVKTQEQVTLVTEQLKGGANFATVAADFSTCPSGRQGGSLGSFGPGAMVKEFDEVIFDPETELGAIVGPVQTQFGYHFIVVDKRTGVEEKDNGSE